MRTIYLDYSTSTPIAASVREAMLPFLGEFYGHPSSSHWYGRVSQEAIEDARSDVACLLDCHPSEIIFTSGGTESVNIALLGVASAIGNSFSDGERPHLITSSLEHACVRYCTDRLQQLGWTVTEIGCDEDGVVSMDELESAITNQTRLITLIHASHRIGTVQPVERVAEICQERDILLHTDASQSVGKIATHVDSLGVDLLSLSGHKFYAPKGIGALYVRTGVPIEPVLFGEGCEAGLRPGTASVSHIVGLGSAAKLVTAGLETSNVGTREMRDKFLSLLLEAVGCPLIVHGEDVDRLPNILSFELPGVTAEQLHQRLPEICFGSPLANGNCNGKTNGHVNNPTYAAMGLSPDRSHSTLRVSFGWTTTDDELRTAVELIASAYDSLRR